MGIGRIPTYKNHTMGRLIPKRQLKSYSEHISSELYSSAVRSSRMAGHVFQNPVDSLSLEPTLIRESGDTKIYAHVDSVDPMFYYITVETRGQKQRAQFQKGDAKQYFDIPEDKIKLVEDAAIGNSISNQMKDILKPEPPRDRIILG